MASLCQRRSTGSGAVSNELNDFMIADSISGVFGAPKRYAAKSLLELRRARVAAFNDFENGITGTPFLFYGTNSSSVASAGLSVNNTCVLLSALGAASTKAAIHMMEDPPTSAKGRLYYSTVGALTFECYIRVQSLSTVSEEYELRIGFGDRADVGDSNFIGFVYRRLSSTNWIARCKKAGTASDTTMAHTVAAFTFVKLRFEVNAAGNSVAFYINDVLRATIATSNIPNTISNIMSPFVGVNITATAGAIAKLFYIDWVSYDIRLANAR